MRFITLGAGVTLATISQAFLLPPTISNSDSDVVNALPFDAAIEAEGRMLAVNCPGCPISAQDVRGGRHDLKGLNRLLFNFSVSHDNDLDRVLLNGRQFYPIDMESSLERLTAPQLIKTSEGNWVQAAEPDLGYALRIHKPISYSKQDEIDLLIATLEIIEVGNTFVDTVDNIELKILTTPSGKLMIGDAQVIPSPPKSHLTNPTSDGQECTTVLCKWRAIMTDKLSALKKGCGGKADPTSHNNRPQGHVHQRPHGRPHRFSHKHHGITRFLRGVVLHVVIPVIIGIVAGITASLVGMIAGHLVIFIWRLLFRRGCQSQYTKVQQEELVAEEGSQEDKGLIQHQGPPPVYEDIVKEDKA
ncbi:dca12f6a-2730-4213-b13c-52742267e632 [Sclerotinia trifoliorum]|uniref:Dca12f6a-2730-4213-b13c-52742267e632 n=1 Tax=Sclerotinia trifoliorum TaxID=28548 RepID=A0A8H2ZN46_9HELO|nr:dca12f6a-2730-4213-b13c-52742267e632 [Sclerotinia trifoliorum]